MFPYLMFLNFAALMMRAQTQRDPVSMQLCHFWQNTSGPVGIITTSAGAPVDNDDAYNLLDKNLINEELFMDVMTHLVREKIPERVVHPKGNGAFGYFEVTNNISRSICKADLFNKVGKRTPIAVRFSHTFRLPGEADTLRNLRGFSIKFYTEEGNFDIAGLNMPVFVYKDPVSFNLFAHCTGRNPVTHLLDSTALFNMFTAIPESLFFYLYFFGESGIPYSFRHMPGYGIHSYQLINNEGETFFVRFHILPDQGTKFYSLEQAKRTACQDPEHYTRDLYNAIGNSNYPSWSVKVQIFTMEDVAREGLNLFDVTRLVSDKKFVPQTIGKIVLNKNPENYFADIEQLAFCPGNLVPGICGAPDKIFETRRLFYRDAQNYRLGGNFKRIHVNRPRNKVNDYTRDGVAPIGKNYAGEPNYFPNNFHGPVARKEMNKCSLIKIEETPADNLDQVRDYYMNLCPRERQYIMQATAQFLYRASEYMQKKAIRTIKKSIQILLIKSTKNWKERKKTPLTLKQHHGACVKLRV